MDMDTLLKDRMVMIANMVGSIEIEESFWDEKNPIWQIPNNHTVYMLRWYYKRHEYDDEFKNTFGKFLDMTVWLYVSFPEWRARLGWITWFLQLYVVDKQLIKEPLPPEYQGRWDPETWTDPRKWMTATGVPSPTITVESNGEVRDVSVGRPADKTTPE